MPSNEDIIGTDENVASARQLAASARAERLRNPETFEQVAANPAPPETPEPTPIPAYVVSLDVADEGIAVTILVPWPNVTIGPGDGAG